MKSRDEGAWFAGIRRDAKRVAAGFGLVVGLLASGAANAILCSTEVPIMPDGRDNAFNVTSTGTSFNWDAVAGRSYSVEAIDDLGFTGNTIINVNSGGFCPISNFPGLNVTSLQEPLGGDNLGTTAANFTMYRASFIATTTQRMDAMIVAPNAVLGVNGHLRVYETTLFQPLWGTSGGFHTFWNIANTTMQPCNATLTLLSAAGTTVTSVTKTVPADGAVEVDTIGMMVPLNQIGKATIAHDCAPGALAVDTFLENVTTSAVLPAKIFTRNQLR